MYELILQVPEGLSLYHKEKTIFKIVMKLSSLILMHVCIHTWYTFVLYVVCIYDPRSMILIGVSMMIFVDKRTDQQTSRVWELDIRTGFGLDFFYLMTSY